MATSLAPLAVGDKIPNRIIGGVPTWLVVTAVVADGQYEVEWPDKTRSTLSDSR